MSVTKIAFVGHIDHGKSTLCGRLLAESGAVTPDKLEDLRQACQGNGGAIDYAFCMDAFCEERENLMTIDITQIPVRIAGRNYLVIDTPGHAEFIRNMITGACQADAAILVVDAAEGIREQTRRHAAILSFLGINQCIVAINKMDRISYDELHFYKLKRNVEELMASPFFARKPYNLPQGGASQGSAKMSHGPAYNAMRRSPRRTDRLPRGASLGITLLHIIPVSAVHGDNLLEKSNAMQWYRGNTLVEALTALRTTEESPKDLRVAIQDVYSINGKKIAAARVEAGCIHQGMKVMVEPEHVEINLSDIIRYPQSVKSAKSGDCIGLVTDRESFLRRGQILCNPDSMPHVTDHIWANLIWLSETPFKSGMSLTLKLLTQESGCRIAQIKQRMDSSTLEDEATEEQILCLSDIGHVSIETDKPLVWDAFKHIPGMGRFVLESDGKLVGAGTIFDI